jgi:hypothetical protein
VVRPDATGNLRSVPENCIIYLSVSTLNKSKIASELVRTFMTRIEDWNRDSVEDPFA